MKSILAAQNISQFPVPVRHRHMTDTCNIYSTLLHYTTLTLYLCLICLTLDQGSTQSQQRGLSCMMWLHLHADGRMFGCL